MYQTENADDIWDILYHSDKKGYMMACGVSGDTQEEVDGLSSLGLVNGHAYSLINCAQVTDRRGNQACIV